MEYVSIASTMILSSGGLVMILENISNKHINLATKACIIYFWICSFLPFLLVPLDFSFFNYKQEDKTALGVLWKIYYFLNLLNGQVLLPVMIAWVGSGYVVPRERAIRTLIEVFAWIGVKLVGLIISIVVGTIVAIYVFRVEFNVLDFLMENSINWLNTSFDKKVLPTLYCLLVLRTNQHPSPLCQRFALIAQT